MMPFGYDRWYTVDVFPTREEAVARARIGREKEEPGTRVWAIEKGRNGWVVKWASRKSTKDMERTRYYNRREREEASGQRKAFG